MDAFARHLTLGLVVLLSGCVSMTGPCEIDAERERLMVQCEAGGSATVVAPASALDEVKP